MARSDPAYSGRATDLRQPAPDTIDGANWYVFEHLIELDLRDGSTLAHMTKEQRLVFAMNYLIQEVNAGGFEGYFNWTAGKWLVPVLVSGDQFAPGLSDLLQSAMEVRKQQLTEGVTEDAWKSVDDRFHALDASIGDRLDTFIDHHRAASFL
jgi:hypothetical protein